MFVFYLDQIVSLENIKEIERINTGIKFYYFTNQTAFIKISDAATRDEIFSYITQKLYRKENPLI